MQQGTHNFTADGLRGIASLNVVLNHFIAAFFPCALYNLNPELFQEDKAGGLIYRILSTPFLSIFYNGHYAVLIFFVLSGYVLALPYWADKKNTIDQRFWSRYLRLNIPIAVSIFISFALYQNGFYHNREAAALSGSRWLMSFFDGTEIGWVELIKIMAYGSIARGYSFFNNPLWTLKFEFIGSLLLLGAYRLKPSGFDWIFTAIMCALLFLFFKEESIYYMCFFFGALMGKGVSSGFKKYALPLFLSGCFLGAFTYESTLYDWLPRLTIFNTKTFYNACGAVCLTQAIVMGFGKQFFESRALRYLGKVSFSLYLVHFLVLCSVSSFFYVLVSQKPEFIFLIFVFYIVFSLIIATVYEALVDVWAIRFARNVTQEIFAIKNAGLNVYEAVKCGMWKKKVTLLSANGKLFLQRCWWGLSKVKLNTGLGRIFAQHQSTGSSVFVKKVSYKYLIKKESAEKILNSDLDANFQVLKNSVNSCQTSDDCKVLN